MNRLSKVLVIMAVIFILVAIVIKMTTVGKPLPGALPINWARLTDTALLFSIAVSMLQKK